jgi:nitroreductase
MIDLLRKRRSIRKYREKKIDRRTVAILKEALLRSPSSRDIKPWHFILVDDPILLQKLSKSKEHGAEFLANAPLGIVVCGDTTKSDVWVEDCSIASILVQMTAQASGLGSCWIQIRNRKTADGKKSDNYIRNLLGIPAPFSIESIIAIGYPAEKKRQRAKSALEYGKVSNNKFGIKG